MKPLGHSIEKEPCTEPGCDETLLPATINGEVACPEHGRINNTSPGMEMPQDLYFQGLYDGMFMFSNVDSEAELIENGELVSAIYERYGRAHTDAWDLPTGEWDA